MLRSLFFVLFFYYNLSSLLAQDSSKAAALRFYEKGRINGYAFYQFGRASDYHLSSDGSIDFSSPVHRFRNSLGINLGINLLEHVYLRTTFYYHFNKNINAPWIHTDYTFSLERTKWTFHSLSYGYVNYQINKYADMDKNWGTRCLLGSFYLRYFNQLPLSFWKLFNIHKVVNFNYHISAVYAFRYLNNQGEIKGNGLEGKPLINFSGRYTFFKHFFLEGGINCYPVRSTKVNSDADFTYGFGYNRYSHFTIGITYGNYAINRFPWNKKGVSGYGFLDGNFNILLNYRW